MIDFSKLDKVIHEKGRLSIMTLLACTTFLVAKSFEVLLFAQILLAAGVAFQSGSDSALLYDSLRALDRH